MSKYRKHIWANETMPYYKQYLNEMEAQIDKLTKEGGGGGSSPLYIATYIISAINSETNFTCNFAVQHFQTDNTLADDVQDVVDIVTENGEREDIFASGYIAGNEPDVSEDMFHYPLSSIHNMYISDDNKLVVEFWPAHLGDPATAEFTSYELKASNIKEVAAGGGGGGGSGMQKYMIYLDWDDENEEYIFTHDGERLTFDDVYDAIRLFIQHKVTGYELFGRVWRHRIDAWQIGDKRIGMANYRTILPVDCYAREVSDVLIGTGKAIEKRSLAGILIADQGECYGCSFGNGSFVLIVMESYACFAKSWVFACDDDVAGDLLFGTFFHFNGFGVILSQGETVAMKLIFDRIAHRSGLDHLDDGSRNDAHVQQMLSC